ncbi:MAG: aldo/keto reductase [Bacteroidaceae bacterium]|nr:aldo/keto reductase [Bacteroidaceae bacterium]MBQ4163267.1 aldo/keto reductase [Parabacteroides sp.]
MKANKLILGTVQFGVQYGVNSAGRPDAAMVYSILEEAYNNNIRILDTSSAYGNAEEILGTTIDKENLFKIVSKYPKCDKSVKECFDQSLKDLKVERLYGYLLHHFSVYQENPTMWKDMLALKYSGKVKKVGFSLYSPSELEIILNDNIEFDIIQIPYNIFDRQFESYFSLLKEKGVEIHVRSTFLQGLFFKERNHLPPKLQPLKPYLEQLDVYAQNQQISIAELALNYNLQNKYIDGVLIGVDNVEQLKTNLSSIIDFPINLSIPVKEKELLNPVNWK